MAAWVPLLFTPPEDDQANRGGLSMGYPMMTRYCGAMVAPMLLSPGAVVHHPVHEGQVVASKFMFEPAAIEVSAGKSVRLVLRSKDTVHGFSIPTLKIDAQIPRAAATRSSWSSSHHRRAGSRLPVRNSVAAAMAT
jgi:heme/copper-type cytochrome/quinol oxidase subunit 2